MQDDKVESVCKVTTVHGDSLDLIAIRCQYRTPTNESQPSNSDNQCPRKAPPYCEANSVWGFHWAASATVGGIFLHKDPRLLPIMFIITADIAGGNATIAELKWAVANTTPNDEFCIPT